MNFAVWMKYCEKNLQFKRMNKKVSTAEPLSKEKALLIRMHTKLNQELREFEQKHWATVVNQPIPKIYLSQFPGEDSIGNF